MGKAPSSISGRDGSSYIFFIFAKRTRSHRYKKMGQSNSAMEDALEEDVTRVQSVLEELHSVVLSTENVKNVRQHSTHTEYTIRTTDRRGIVSETNTRYSDVIELLDQLKQRRGVELPEMPRKHLFHSLDDSVIQERQAALDTILAAAVPRHAGIPQVRRFLRLD